MRNQDKAVRYVGLAVTDSNLQLRSFGCLYPAVGTVTPGAVACALAFPMQPQTILVYMAVLLLPPPGSWGISTVSSSLLYCSQMGDRPVDHRSCLPTCQRWQPVVRLLEDPDSLTAHLHSQVHVPVPCLPSSCLAMAHP